MLRIWILASAIVSLAPATGSTETNVTWTGWFSDANCAAPRAGRGVIEPNGTECVKRCLDKGVTPIFISEQARAVFEVKNYPTVKDDVGYHIELTGTIDEVAKVITVESVKRLELVASQCALPKKPGK